MQRHEATERCEPKRVPHAAKPTHGRVGLAKVVGAAYGDFESAVFATVDSQWRFINNPFTPEGAINAKISLAECRCMRLAADLRLRK
jgi:hypothetical protein